MLRKLGLATLCLHVKESCKACEESGKACEESDKTYEESDKVCEESDKAPCEKTSKPPFRKRSFVKRFFCSFENSLQGYSKSLFQKESPRGQCQFLCF